MEEISGILHAFWETGTEGVYWAIQDDRYIKGEHWDYGGLHILKPGDWLTIRDPDGMVVWGGIVSFDYSIRQYGAFWVHGMPDNFDKDLWYNIFVSEKHTGILVKQAYKNGLAHSRKE